jgi:endonuclease-8
MGTVPEGDTVWLAGRRLNEALAGRTLRRFELRVPRFATADLSGRAVTGVVTRGKHLLVRFEGGVTLHSHLRMDGEWRIHRAGTAAGPAAAAAGAGRAAARASGAGAAAAGPARAGRGRPDRRAGRPEHEIRAVLANDEWAAIGYRVHDLVLVETAREDTLVGHLGPDLLGPDWDLARAHRRQDGAGPDRAVGQVRQDGARSDRAVGQVPPDPRNPVPALHTDASAAVREGFWVEDEAVRRLRGSPELPVGEALLDQRNVAGIGTIYRAETLFLAGVSPWTPVGEVADPGAVVRLARRLLMANREHPGQVTTGDRRRGRELWVYGRAGEPCRRCGTAVRRGMQGPAAQERVLYWCPACQPPTADPA